jgi:hypothetical protein
MYKYCPGISLGMNRVSGEFSRSDTTSTRITAQFLDISAADVLSALLSYHFLVLSSLSKTIKLGASVTIKQDMKQSKKIS